MSNTRALAIQMRIKHYKAELKKDPTDLAFKILLASNRAKLKKYIYRRATL